MGCGPTELCISLGPDPPLEGALLGRHTCDSILGSQRYSRGGSTCLSAVSKLDVSHKGSAVMRPVIMSTVATYHASTFLRYC